MRNLKWIVLSLSALVMLSIAIYVGNQSNTDKERSYQIPISDKELDTLAILRDGELYFEFKKTDKWKIMNASQDVYSVGADQNFLDKFIEKIIESRLTPVATYERDDQLSEFGLKQPRYELKFKNKDRTTYTLKVSKKKNYEGKHFYRNDSDKKIYISDIDLFKDLQNDTIYFLNKRISHPDWALVDRVRIDGLNETFYLVKDQDRWSISGSDYQLDPDLVRLFFSKFSDITIQKYVSQDSAKLFWSSLNQKHDISMQFLSGQNSWSLRLSMDEDNRVLMAKEDHKNYILEPTLWQFFANLDTQFFYDKKSFFVFDKSKAKKIQVTYLGQNTVLSKSDQSFELLIEELHNLEADGIDTKKNMSSPNCQIEVLDEKNQKIISVTLATKATNGKIALLLDKVSYPFFISQEKYSKLNLEKIHKGLK